MTLRDDIIGVILAGGKSSRMGSDKALLDLNGKPFIRHIADVFRQFFTTILISADDDALYSFLDVPVITDIVKNSGPLGGIHSGLKHSHPRDIFIVACDMPFIEPDAVTSLLSICPGKDVVIFSVDGQIQPLFGLYRKTCLPLIEEHLGRGQYAVLGCLEKLQTVTVAIPSPTIAVAPGSLRNINSSEDYRSTLTSNKESDI